MSILPDKNNLKGAQLISGTGSHSVNIASGESAQLIIESDGADFKVDITIEEGANAEIIQLNSSSSESKIRVTQMGSSELRMLSLHLGCSSSNISVMLEGEGATCRVNTLQMLSLEEQSAIQIAINHTVPKCESATHSKILVSGSSKAELRARAVVAKDAQESVANQSLRSIELNSGARAKLWPELEIYADDVKCSHGATVGQIDSDAILYMRQRGLSLEQARILQIEGFIADVAKSVSIEAIDSFIEESIKLKFNEL